MEINTIGITPFLTDDMILIWNLKINSELFVCNQYYSSYEMMQHYYHYEMKRLKTYGINLKVDYTYFNEKAKPMFEKFYKNTRLYTRMADGQIYCTFD